MSSIEEKQTLTEGSSDLAFQSEEGDVSAAFVEAGEEGDMPMPTAAGTQQPAPLVLMKHILPPKSTLELKEDFKAHQGSNGVWEARPPVLHFGGYTPNRPHKQVVSIVNCTSRAQRLHLLPPRSPYVTFSYDKEGNVGPGMSQAVTVTFTPHEEGRYYYDVLRIHCKGGNLHVPCHAYAVANVLRCLPPRVDMGHCPLHHTTTKTITLACQVPLSFSFELTVVRGHPDFRVSPMSGVIPANGHTLVHIHFTPQVLRTCFLELRVGVSQYNFSPYSVTVVASSLPLHIRRQALVNAAQDLGLLAKPHTSQHPHQDDTQGGEEWAGPEGPGSAMDDENQCPTSDGNGQGLFNKTSAAHPSGSKKANQHSGQAKVTKGEGPLGEGPLGVQAVASALSQVASHDDSRRRAESIASFNRRPHPYKEEQEGAWQCLDHYDVSAPSAPLWPGSGAAFDAGGQWLEDKKRRSYARVLEGRRASAIAKERQRVEDEAQAPDHFKDGLTIPEDLSTQAAVNSVLTQQPGKLRPQDLQAAVEEVRRVRAEQQKQQDAIRTATTTTGVGESSGLSAASILAELQASQSSQPLTKQLKELIFLQELAEVETSEREREFKASVQHIGERTLRAHDVSRIQWTRESIRLQAERAQREADRQQTKVIATGPFQHAAIAQRPETVLGWQPAGPPLGFDLYRADEWRQRIATLRKLIYLVSKVIVRCRAAKRLSAIRRWLGLPHIHRTRDEVRRMVEEDWEAAGSAPPSTSNSKTAQASQADLFDITHDKVRGVVFPLWEESSSRPTLQDEDEEEDADKDADKTEALPRFSDWTTFDLREPKEASVMGYSELRLPAHAFYPPVETERPLRPQPPPPDPSAVPITPAVQDKKGGK